MKILLVEDEEGIAIYIRTIMEPCADIVHHVKTLQGCRGAIKTETYDVILLDLKLDDSPAPLTIAEIQKIKEAQPKAALIVNTGMEAYADSAREAGADFVLVKEPESMERKAFCTAIAMVLEKKGSLAQSMELLKKVAQS